MNGTAGSFSLADRNSGEETGLEVDGTAAGDAVAERKDGDRGDSQFVASAVACGDWIGVDCSEGTPSDDVLGADCGEEAGEAVFFDAVLGRCKMHSFSRISRGSFVLGLAP